MANEQVIIDVEINNDDARQKTIALTQQIEKQRQELARYRKALKESNGENAEAAQKVAELSQSIKDNNAELRRAQKEANAEANSINALRASINKLNAQRNAVNTSTEEGAKKFAELTDQLKDQREALNELSQEAGSFKDNIGNYTESVKTAFRETQFFGVSIQGLETAFNQTRAVLISSIKSLGAFRLALIATGIGAFVVVLGSLVAFFTRTQKGIDIVNQKLKGLSAVVSVIIDRFAAAGEALSNISFSDLGDSILSFVNGIGQTLLTFFTSLKDLIVGVITLDSDQIEKGSNSFKALVDQIATNTKDTLNGISEDVAAVTEQIAKTNELAQQIEKERQALRDRRIKFITQEAQLNRRIEEEREKFARSANQDQQALANVIELINIRTAKQISLKQQELALLDREQALSSNLAEDDEKRAQLAAEIIELRARAAAERREALGQITQLEKTAREQEAKEIEKAADSIGKLRDEQSERDKERATNRAEVLTDETNKVVAAQIKAIDEVNDREQVLTEARKQRFEEEEEARNQLLGATNDFFSASVEAATKAFGEQSAAARALIELQKTVSAAQITIDGITEIQGIFKSFSGLGPFGQALAIVRAAAAAVRTATALSNINSVGFASGGYTGDGGKYQPAGVVHKGEFVVSKAQVSRLGGPKAVSRMTGQPMKGFANGGVVSNSIETSVTESLEINRVSDAIRNMTIAVAVTDINKAQNKRVNVENIANQ